MRHHIRFEEKGKSQNPQKLPNPRVRVSVYYLHYLHYLSPCTLGQVNSSQVNSTQLNSKLEAREVRSEVFPSPRHSTVYFAMKTSVSLLVSCCSLPAVTGASMNERLRTKESKHTTMRGKATLFFLLSNKMVYRTLGFADHCCFTGQLSNFLCESGEVVLVVR